MTGMKMTISVRSIQSVAGATRSVRSIRYAAGALVIGLAILLGGCAGVAEMTGTATQQDLTQLRADVNALQLAVQRSKGEAEKQSSQLEARARAQARDGQRQTEELAKRIDAQSTTLSSLTARLDELNARVDALGRRIASAPPAAPRPPAPPSGTRPPSPAPTAPAPTAPAPPAGGVQPHDVYQAAYLDFSKGSYQLAVAGFREFLRRYPDHELAGNAQYWIGESYFSLARTHANAGQADKVTPALEQAVQEFRKVIANHPRGEKAPTALYKEALALIELKQPDRAQTRLQYLIDNFPQAQETPLARERLASLKGSG
jgi:tol-pal system protein YbgF